MRSKKFIVSKNSPINIFMPKIKEAINALSRHYQRYHKITPAEYCKAVRIENESNPAMQTHSLDGVPILISESISDEHHVVYLTDEDYLVVIED